MSEQVTVEQTERGRQIVVARTVGASREKAWELLTDTERWPEWGPSVRAVDCEKQYIAAGTRGRVELPVGVWVPFEITACENYRWHWDVARIPATGHRVDETPDGCRVCFEIPLLAGGYVPVCTHALRKITTVLASERRANGKEKRR